jgi:uncharacterized protein (DUF305 family)
LKEDIFGDEIMKNQTLMSSLVRLIVGGTVTGFLLLNGTQSVGQKPSVLAQTPPQTAKEQDPHHPQASPSPSTSSSPSGMGMMNKQNVDRHFIEMMIPHHQSAVDMANLALKNAKQPELKKLAQAIKTGQTKEIQSMKAWYKKWYGTDVPTKSGMGMSMNSNTGMCQGMQMMNMDLTALKTATNFDRVFSQQMIPHHQMAVMMSARVLNSSHPELRNLAKAIIQTQSAEIEQMRRWQ